MIGGPGFRSEPVGVCIYCGAKTYQPHTVEKLHDEHVLPEGLGGDHVLVEASCRKCEEKFNEFEGPVIRSILQMARLTLPGIKRKPKKNRKPDKVRITIERDGKSSTIDMLVADAPKTLVLPILGPPKVTGLGEPGVTGFYHLQMESLVGALQRLGKAESVTSPILDQFHFARFLAKIAYASAVLYRGWGSFEVDPPLLALIKTGEGAERWADLVGGYVGPPIDDSIALHEVGTETFTFPNGEELLMADIRLFAALRTPRYWVAVAKSAVSGNVEATKEAGVTR